MDRSDKNPRVHNEYELDHGPSPAKNPTKNKKQKNKQTPPPQKPTQNTYSQARRHGLSYTWPSTPQTGLYMFPGQEQNGASVAEGYCSVGVISPAIIIA